MQPLGKPNLYDDWGPALEPISIANTYMEGVEQGGPPGLRALPHFRAKNTLLSLNLLAPMLGDTAPMPPARVGMDGDDDIPTVWQLSRRCVDLLAAMNTEQLRSLARQALKDLRDVSLSDELVLQFTDAACRLLQVLAQEAQERQTLVCEYFALHYYRDRRRDRRSWP